MVKKGEGEQKAVDAPKGQEVVEMNAGEKMIWYRIKYTAKQRTALPKRTKKRIVEDILGRDFQPCHR